MGELIDRRPPARLNWIIAWFMRWRLWILGSIGLVIIVAELIEHPINSSQFDPINFGEIVLFLSFLVIIAVLLQSLIRAVESETHANNILNIKHLLAQQLSNTEGWQELTDRLYEFIGSFAPITSIDFLIPAHDSTDFKVFTGGEFGVAIDEEAEFRGLAYCQNCCSRENNTVHAMQSCSASEALHPKKLMSGYCLPIGIWDSRIALLQLYLAPASSLSSDQVDILNNISPEIALALKIIQQRTALSEYLVSNTVDTTKREISHELHDTVGQNLAYLRLKLEQLSSHRAISRRADLRVEMDRMAKTANESYLFVRDTLENIRTGTPVPLEQLLQDYGASVSERAGFDVKLNCSGQPLNIPAHLSRRVFYIIREAFNNIEKHAECSQVAVELAWGKTDLTVKVTDNGKGFDPAKVAQENHYGLAIMQERVQVLNGHIRINSEKEAGTEITLWVPLET